MSVLIARLDSAGDVLLAGPAVRAVARREPVVLLVSPEGEAAARLLPDVAEVLVWSCPWSGYRPPPVDLDSTAELIEGVAARDITSAIVLTSFHQSPLPLALLLRLAGVTGIAATSVDYPGSLLDVRHSPPDGDRHEVEQNLSLVAAAGFPPWRHDDGRLLVRRPLPDLQGVPDGPYVVVHPGAAVPARAPLARTCGLYVMALRGSGRRVVVTGGPGEQELTRAVAAHGGLDLGGATDLDELATVLDRADCVVTGNTGPAHLAAATGTPVVSLFAPVVPAERWRPWGVPHVLLGDQDAPCRGTRARTCPVPGHPCLAEIRPAEVVAAVETLAPARVTPDLGPDARSAVS